MAVAQVMAARMADETAILRLHSWCAEIR